MQILHLYPCQTCMGFSLTKAKTIPPVHRRAFDGILRRKALYRFFKSLCAFHKSINFMWLPVWFFNRSAVLDKEKYTVTILTVY